MISRTETMDILYLKHGLKMSDLLRAVTEHSLNEDEDIIKLAALHTVSKEKMIQKAEEAAYKEYQERLKAEEAKEEQDVAKAVGKKSKKKSKAAKEEEPIKLDIEGGEEGKIQINESKEEYEKAKQTAEESKKEAEQS